MGPLVPFIFSNEFGLLMTVFIGIAFGFILEQAGFSSTKKLVGLFYGNDFTVLRVFFTAGVTAMVGVMLLGHYGLLDLDVIYINPTFVRSALVGGVIMGAGFIIGGFCPGTSVCAAAIGKLDAMLFILGSVLGIFAFLEVYPAIKDFYMADAMGPVKIYEQLGMHKEIFALMLTLIALFAFVATWYIEKRVNNEPAQISPSRKRRYALAMALPVVVILLLMMLPNKQEIIQNRIAEAKRQQKCVFHEIDADNLAYQIVNHYYDINIIDVRPPEEFEKFHIPMAINIPFESLMDRQWEDIFKQTIKTNIFYAESDTLVRMSCLKAKYIGNSENLILKESASEFQDQFYSLEMPEPEASRKEHQLYFFRAQQANKMEDLKKALENIGKPVKKEVIVVQGGCS